MSDDARKVPAPPGEEMKAPPAPEACITGPFEVDAYEVIWGLRFWWGAIVMGEDGRPCPMMRCHGPGTSWGPAREDHTIAKTWRAAFLAQRADVDRLTHERDEARAALAREPARLRQEYESGYCPICGSDSSPDRRDGP